MNRLLNWLTQLPPRLVSVPSRLFFATLILALAASNYSPLFDFSTISSSTLRLFVIDVAVGFSKLFLVIYVLRILISMFCHSNSNGQSEEDTTSLHLIQTLPMLYMFFAAYYIWNAIEAIHGISRSCWFILDNLKSKLIITDSNAHAEILDTISSMADWFPVGGAILFALFLMHGSRALFVIHELDCSVFRVSLEDRLAGLGMASPTTPGASLSDWFRELVIRVKKVSQTQAADVGDWMVRFLIGLIFILLEKNIGELHIAWQSTQNGIYDPLFYVAKLGMTLYFLLFAWGILNVFFNIHNLPFDNTQKKISYGGFFISLFMFFMMDTVKNPDHIFFFMFILSALILAGSYFLYVLIKDFFSPGEQSTSA